ncbi:MAG: CBS and ACT domain-containing protein [Deltaproteobacteria bacterium]
MLVGRRMTKDPKTVSPDDTLGTAAGMMRESRINHLPVVEGGRLVGILSDTDLRNASLASGPLPAPEGTVDRDRRVREVMKTEVWSLTPEDSVEDALLIITRKRFGALPVLSGDKLVGIITKIDLLNAVIDVLNLDEVGMRIEVSLPATLSRLEELAAVLDGLSVRVRSCIVTPQGGTDRMVALLRLDTIEGTRVIAALRSRRFDVLGKTDFA